LNYSSKILFSKIYIRIAYADFKNVRLTNSSFDDYNLAHAKFNQANISYCEFQNCDLINATVGQIKIQEHISIVTTIAFSNENL